MAQAARLNLRMQKEIKLLLTDPPPGVSVPMLSGDSDLSSLSIIDAQVEGPEGSVYAKGIFNIKIQIPERYPFQPPIVTFSTPIYHPNIDNGGRICLDILNVPPKGAWQPSLNISTVLTSIGLLLSEPNPDDGLMCEVSKEYKYNRQAFDQNARSLTERYAKPGASGNGSGSRSIPTTPISNMIVVEEPALESKDAVNEYVISHKKLCGISQKLSLESSSSTQKRDHDEENLVPTHQLFANAQSLSMYSSKSFPMTQATNCDEQFHQDNDEKTVNDSINMNSRKLCGIRKKLSLKSVGSSERRDGDNKENQLLISQCQSNSTAPLKPLSIKQVGSCDDESPCQDTGGTMLGYKKVSGISQKLSLESLNPLQKSDADDKANMVIQQLSCIHPQNLSVASSKSLLVLQSNGCDEQHHHRDCDEKIGNGSFKHQVEASPIIESVIVLDSEDSEEEGKGPMKSRLSLSRKRLAGKLKAKACT